MCCSYESTSSGNNITSTMPASPTKVIARCKDSSEVTARLCGFVEQRFKEFSSSQEGGENKRKFVIGLSGGSLPKFFSAGAAAMEVDWSRVAFIFCDERLVPFDDGDSTFKVYREAMVGKVEGVNEESFVVINPKLDAEGAAKDYWQKLQSLEVPLNGSGFPRYDVLLLGMGPDGHTASLFPGHPLLEESSLRVAPISDSPKPPPGRVTLTYPVLNAASAVVFVCTGEGKREVARRVLEEEGCPLPAARVDPGPHGGELVWILDEAAAQNLKG